MKKIGLSLLLLAGTLPGASAQPGIRAGYNLSTIGGDASGYNTTSGFHAGLFFMKRNEKTSMMFEVIYSSQGTETPAGTKFTYRYALLPVVFNFHLDKVFFAQVGAQPGILIDGDVSGTDITEQLNKFDFAGVVGFGAELDKVVLNARYNYGFTTTYKLSSGHFPNMVFQISIGYRLSSS